jgi:hypothetical protein
MNSERAVREMRRLVARRNAGTLSVPQYRRLRASLLDRLAGLEAKSADPDPTRPREEEPARRPPTESGQNGIQSAPRALMPGPVAALRWFALSVGVVALAGAGWWLWLRPAPPEVRFTASVTSARTNVNPEAAAPADIAEFLRRDDWTDASIAKLNGAWLKMSDQEIIATLSSDSARRLAEQLPARLRQAASQASSGAAQLDPDAPLLVLARRLNVPVPEDIATARPGKDP